MSGTENAMGILNGGDTGTDEKPKAAKKTQPKKKQGPKYIFHCSGRYYTQKDPQTKERTTKAFSVKVAVADMAIFDQTAEIYKGIKYDEEENAMLPQFKTVSFKNFLGVLRKKLLMLLLAKKHPDFHRVHTLHVNDVEFADGADAIDLPIKLMNKDMLKTYLSQNSIPLNIDEYVDLNDLKADIDLYLEAPRKFKRTIAVRKERRQIERDFMELNDLDD